MPTCSTRLGFVSRLFSMYVFMPQPANTPIAPSKRSGTWPDVSSASHADSRKCRCCGSMIAASRGPMPKNAASNGSTSSSDAVAAHVVRVVQHVLAAHRRRAATPRRGRRGSPRRRATRRQSASTSGAPGKRPAIPTMAMSDSADVGWRLSSMAMRLTPPAIRRDGPSHGDAWRRGRCRRRRHRGAVVAVVAAAASRSR